jgi:hypothetical protein
MKDNQDIEGGSVVSYYLLNSRKRLSSSCINKPLKGRTKGRKNKYINTSLQYFVRNF